MDHNVPTVVRIAPWCFAFIAGLALVAFWPRYLAAPKSGFSAFHHLHAATGAAWLTLLIAQPALAARHSLRAHRVVGRVGVVVMAALLAAFVGLSHSVLQGKTGEEFGLEAYLTYLRLVEGSLVAGCFVLAIAYRRNTPVHSRLMICTGIPLVDPVIHRLGFSALQDWDFNYQLLSWSIVAAILVGFMWLERRERAGRCVFPAFLAVFSVLFIPPMFDFWSWGKPWDAWKAVVGWYAGLPITT